MKEPPEKDGWLRSRVRRVEAPPPAVLRALGFRFTQTGAFCIHIYICEHMHIKLYRPISCYQCHFEVCDTLLGIRNLEPHFVGDC